MENGVGLSVLSILDTLGCFFQSVYQILSKSVGKWLICSVAMIHAALARENGVKSSSWGLNTPIFGVERVLSAF